jgi:hypothetical protein
MVPGSSSFLRSTIRLEGRALPPGLDNDKAVGPKVAWSELELLDSVLKEAVGNSRRPTRGVGPTDTESRR